MIFIENDWSIIELFIESGFILLCNEYVNNVNVLIV